MTGQCERGATRNHSCESRNPGLGRGRGPAPSPPDAPPSFLRKQESIPGTRERPRHSTSPLWVPACAGTTWFHRLSCESRNPSLGRVRGPDAPPPPSGYPLARARRGSTVFPAKAGIQGWGGVGFRVRPRIKSCPRLRTGNGAGSELVEGCERNGEAGCRPLLRKRPSP